MAMRVCGAGFRCHACSPHCGFWGGLFGHACLWRRVSVSCVQPSLWVFGWACLATRVYGAGFRCHARSPLVGFGGACLAMHVCGAGFRCHARSPHCGFWGGLFGHACLRCQVLVSCAQPSLWVFGGPAWPRVYLHLPCFHVLMHV